MTTTDKGAKAPEIPEEMVGKVAALLIDRGHYRVLDEADAAAWEILAGAGVPALLARVAEMEGAWQPIETAPASGQFLVTDWRPAEDEYNTVEMVQGPFLNDGRILNLNSGNYTNAGVWTWWRPLPPLPGRGL